MSTRVCVKQLPSHATEEKLRELFADVGRVTDCRLMKRQDGRSRRFAFVGFATPEDAESALSLDKVFLGTTRIRVEAAFEYKAPSAPRPWSRHTAGSSAHNREHGITTQATSGADTTPAATESRGAESEAAGGKLDEFRAAMRNRNASATWANDDAVASRRTSALTTPSTPATAPGAGAVSDSDDDEHDSDEDEHDSDDDGPRSDRHLDGGNSEYDAEESGKGEDDEDDEMAALMRQAEGAAQGQSASAQALAFLQSKQTAADAPDGSDHDDEDEDDASSQDSALDILEGEIQPARPTRSRREHKEDKEDDLADLRLDDGASDDDEEDVAGAGPTDRAPSGAVSAGGEALAAGRLFVRNLAFTATDADVRAHFERWGAVTEARVLRDGTGRSKGMGFVAYEQEACAAAALAEADLKMFQGRLVHVLPGKAARGGQDEDGEGGGQLAPGQSAYQAEQEAKRRAAAVSGEEDGAWNALFVRADAAVKAAAAAAGQSVMEVMDPSADNLAVRVALGETAVIDQTKAFLRSQGVDLDAVQRALGGTKLRASQRSDTVILVKNLPHTTALAALRGLFGRYGPLLRLVMPPARVLALVEFERPADAKRAFKGLAYKRFESVPLYLEWAPGHSFAESAPVLPKLTEPESQKPRSEQMEEREAIASLSGRGGGASSSASSAPFAHSGAEEQEANEETEEPEGQIATVFVKGLSFGTTEDGLREMFAEIGSLRAVRIPRKQAASSSGGVAGPGKSMGYGFVEFDDSASAVKAVKRLQSAVLDGRSLALSLSHRAGAIASSGAKSGVQRKETASAVTAASKTATKLLVKNLAFEATRNDLRQLFGAFGKLKSVRVPRKPDGSGRGFAFVEFASAADARTAVQSLGATHLYGRHIVMQWAQDDSSMAAVQAKARVAAEKEASLAPAKRRERATPAPEAARSSGKKAKRASQTQL